MRGTAVGVRPLTEIEEHFLGHTKRGPRGEKNVWLAHGRKGVNITSPARVGRCLPNTEKSDGLLCRRCTRVNLLRETLEFPSCFSTRGPYSCAQEIQRNMKRVVSHETSAARQRDRSKKQAPGSNQISTYETAQKEDLRCQRVRRQRRGPSIV